MYDIMDGNKKNFKKNDLPAFSIDNNIVIKLEQELAYQLSQVILNSSTDNTALLALGHQLKNKTSIRER